MSEKSTGGFDSLLAGMLGITFIVLKLTGVITWSWWWVTAPFWGGLALALILIVGILIFEFFWR